MSTLSYGTQNPVVLDTIQTTAFEQTAIYDPTHSDYLYTKVSIGVKAVFNRSTQPHQSSETPAQTMARVRGCLMTPCQQLVFSVGNDILVKSPADGASEDAKHGPQPVRLNIVSITEATFLVEYVVETYIIECCSGNPLPYLSNRWEETDSIDEDMYTRRTIRGRVIFRTDAINSKKFSNNNAPGPDDYRGLISPPFLPLQPNFRRISQDFVGTEDGTQLAYTVVDKEEYVMPPDACTRFQADHTVTTSKGAVYQETVSCKVWGNATTPKAALLANAINVVMQRLDLGGNKKIKAGVVKDTIHENSVEVRVETFAQGRSSTVLGLNVAKPDQLGQLDYLLGDRRSNQQPDPGMRGTANLAMLMFNQYLSLCSTDTGELIIDLKSDGSLPEGFDTSITTGGTVATLSSTPTLFDATPDTVNGVYTDYRLDIEYHTKYNRLQLPYMDSSISSCAVVSLAQPTMTKLVRWSAEKWGDQPEVPAALTTNTNCVLLDAVVRPSNVDVAPDGVTLVYSIEGEYLYAVIDPSQETFNGGTVPYIVTLYGDSRFIDFKNGLADPPSGSSITGPGTP